MSNPFAAFRKNQKTWMAGAVLLAILAFVVAPAIQQASDAFRGGSADNAVVVSWNGGKMTVSDVQNYERKHGILVRFLRNLAEEVIAEGGQPQVPGFFYNAQSNEILSLGVQAAETNADICRTRILASYAEKLGITFTDDAIDEFIKSYCDRRVTSERLAQILHESSSGRLGAFDLRELLKDELAAMVAGQVARSGVYAQTPGKTYRDFRRINQTTTVEAFPVLTDDYLADVTGNPTDAEIQAIYDAGMTIPADPYAAQSGFMRRYHANFEYVEGNLQEWIAREKEKLTEEELRTEYDRRVELGQLQVAVETETEATSDDAGAETNATAERAGAEPESNSDSEANVTQPGVEAEVSGGVDELQLDTPAEQPTEESPDGEQAVPGSGDQSNQQDISASKSKVRYVSYIQDEASDSNTPPPVVQPPQLGAGSESAPASEQQAGPTMRTKTFEEARDEIAESLATGTASPALQAAMTEMTEKHMQPYYTANRQYNAIRDSDSKEAKEATPPKRPDIKKIAESLGLTYVETGMVDAQKLVQDTFGQSSFSANGQSISVTQGMMRPSSDLFRPITSHYFDQVAMQEGRIEFQQFLFWKTEEKEAYIPELEEVREEVVDAWKRDKAQTLAADAAAKLATKVTKGEDAWNAAISDSEKALLLQTDRFSWLTSNPANRSVNITGVQELDTAGSEFMQNVFSAEAGSVVVAPNQPKTTYYVTRVIDFSPTEEELRTRFNNDSQKTGPLAIAQQEINDLIVDWYQSLEKDLGVEWQMAL